MSAEALRAAVGARLPLAESLFDEIRAASAAEAGVTRPRLERGGSLRQRAASPMPPQHSGLEAGYDHAGQPLLHAAGPGPERARPC